MSKPKAPKKGCAGLNRIFTYYRRNCYRNNKYWGLSLEEVEKLVKSDCAYCGKPPANCIKEYDFYYSGIDRKDSKRGYHPKNVVPCCWECNRMKSDHLSHDEMVAAMKEVLRLRAARRVRVP